MRTFEAVVGGVESGEQCRILGETPLSERVHIPPTEFKRHFPLATELRAFHDFRTDPLKPPLQGDPSPWLTCGLEDTEFVERLIGELMLQRSYLQSEAPSDYCATLQWRELVLIEYALLLSSRAFDVVTDDVLSAVLFEKPDLGATHAGDVMALTAYCDPKYLRQAVAIRQNASKIFIAFQPLLPLYCKGSRELRKRFDALKRAARFSCYVRDAEGREKFLPLLGEKSTPTGPVICWCALVPPPATVTVTIKLLVKAVAQHEKKKTKKKKKKEKEKKEAAPAPPPPPPPPPVVQRAEAVAPAPKSKKRKRASESAPAPEPLDEAAEPKAKKQKTTPGEKPTKAKKTAREVFHCPFARVTVHFVPVFALSI